MAASKLEIELELKTSPEKLWKNLKEFVTLLPNAMPDVYEGINVIEGDGRSVGSIFVSTFKPSEMKPVVSISKERLEIVDDGKKILSYSFLEGEILENYKNFRVVIYVGSSTKSDGALVKYTAEFNKANEQVADPHIFKSFVVKLFMAIDAYLLTA
ncbi:MLP-like protein 423 [Salvia divinorum]|uniref:MLP-like protein 423 n=1 Tax=Salvia divinorum TaxID=28513 RepID=A0ABD1G5G0_SALDI